MSSSLSPENDDESDEEQMVNNNRHPKQRYDPDVTVDDLSSIGTVNNTSDTAECGVCGESIDVSETDSIGDSILKLVEHKNEEH